MGLAFQRWVIKLGSSIVCGRRGGGPDPERLAAAARDVAALMAAGAEVVLVSSGAVAAGRTRLGLDPHGEKSLSLDLKQACAAAGQSALMRAWEEALGAVGVTTAQALLTQDDAARRRRWLNARATLERLLAHRVCPVVNENDTVATAELRYGDNDRLAAHVAQMIAADVLVLLSDVDGLYDADPRVAPGARHIPLVEAITPEIDAMAGGAGSGVGTGGMRTKLEAARIATAAGCATVITKGESERPAWALRGGPDAPLADAPRATWFRPALSPEAARKQWIRTHLAPRGDVRVDGGAAAALDVGKSLLPAGVVAVAGQFEKGDAVRVLDAQGREIARGLAAYGATDARGIAGLRSAEVEAALGYQGPAALIHRNDLVLHARASERAVAAGEAPLTEPQRGASSLASAPARSTAPQDDGGPDDG